jgi:glutamate-5-semialdehyde dehydrogenase
MDIKQYIVETGKRAREASRIMAKTDTATKNQMLLNIADLITESQTGLLETNELDLATGKANGLDAALLDRLELTPERIKAMAEGLCQVSKSGVCVCH